MPLIIAGVILLLIVLSLPLIMRLLGKQFAYEQLPAGPQRRRARAELRLGLWAGCAMAVGPIITGCGDVINNRWMIRGGILMPVVVQLVLLIGIRHIKRTLH